jgi:hypothetical protein
MINSPLVFHQILVGLVFIHGRLANHSVHLFLYFLNELFNSLALFQLKTKSRKWYLLCGPVHAESNELIRGPAMRDRPNPRSDELFNDVATTKNRAS